VVAGEGKLVERVGVLDLAVVGGSLWEGGAARFGVVTRCCAAEVVEGCGGVSFRCVECPVVYCVSVTG
jgi:hypothetical protein